MTTEVIYKEIAGVIHMSVKRGNVNVGNQNCPSAEFEAFRSANFDADTVFLIHSAAYARTKQAIKPLGNT